MHAGRRGGLTGAVQATNRPGYLHVLCCQRRVAKVDAPRAIELEVDEAWCEHMTAAVDNVRARVLRGRGSFPKSPGLRVKWPAAARYTHSLQSSTPHRIDHSAIADPEIFCDEPACGRQRER